MTTSSAPSNALILEIATLLTGIVLGTVAAALMVLFIIAAQPVSLPVTELSGIFPAYVQSALATQLQAMGLPLVGDSPAYWYLARVSALIGYFFMWQSILWGLLLSTKIVKTRISPALTFGIHEFLSLMGLGFAAFHAFVLLGDGYLKFGLADLLVPFHASFKSAAVSAGIISLYLYALLVASFYLRKRIGQKVWRAFHYTTFLAYITVTAHGLLVGSDGSLVIVQVMYFAAAASVLFLVYYRILTGGKKPRPVAKAL